MQGKTGSLEVIKGEVWRIVSEPVTSLDRCTDKRGDGVAESLSRLWTETMQMRIP